MTVEQLIETLQRAAPSGVAGAPVRILMDGRAREIHDVFISRVNPDDGEGPAIVAILVAP